MLDGTLECLNAIDNAGHEIHYITNRPLYALEDTKISLDRNKFPQQENLHFAKGDKCPFIMGLNIDVFIDDSPSMIAELSTKTRAQIYCRNYQFNLHLDSNNGEWFKRVDNWKQFMSNEGI